MNLIKECIMALSGFSFGLMASAGVFTVLIAVGLVPRFAGKTHTAKHIFLFEEMVVLGTLVGGIFSIFEKPARVGAKFLSGGYLDFLDKNGQKFLGQFWLLSFGFFAGIFIGCLAIAIAEMLNSIPIFSRRMKIKRGFAVIVLFMALGKVAGSLFYFLFQITN